HFKEGVDITREEYFNKLTKEKKLFPKTYQPSVQDYINAYIPYLKEGKDILSLTISSALSGSKASAKLAAKKLRKMYPGRTIVVLDSLNASVGQHLILREIIKMRDDGLSLFETEEMAEKIIESVRVYFMVERLEYLRRGGRTGRATFFVGTLLGVCPILQIVKGELAQFNSVRGKQKALTLLNESIEFFLKEEAPNINFCIGHVLSEDDAKTFYRNTEAALGMKMENPILDVGLSIAAYGGPGALGFAYCKKYETITLEEGV
ncbi:MAG: DegV family protein, partial [Treponema sp.]|nr:DegV family protein [Treponema sp.]